MRERERQNITLAEVKCAALASYEAGELLAQNPPAQGYGYSMKCPDGSYRKCAIGACLSKKTLAHITERECHSLAIGAEKKNGLQYCFAWSPSDDFELRNIQAAHDEWMQWTRILANETKVDGDNETMMRVDRHRKHFLHLISAPS